ncbi:MAG TPA: STAS domain-containing protein, partial [Thermoanaerobaculia bacterium]
RRGCNDPDVTAVDVVGFLGVKTWNKFEEQMLRYVQSSRRLLIDLGYLVGVDGTGLASLGRVVKEAEQLGVSIQVIRLTPRIADVLSYSALKQVLGRYISTSEETAIRRLKD